MHGSSRDDGTACADKIMEGPVPRTGAGVSIFTAAERKVLTARPAGSGKSNEPTVITPGLAPPGDADPGGLRPGDPAEPAVQPYRRWRARGGPRQRRYVAASSGTELSTAMTRASGNWAMSLTLRTSSGPAASNRHRHRCSSGA